MVTMSIEEAVQKYWRLIFVYLLTWMMWFGVLIFFSFKEFSIPPALEIGLASGGVMAALVWGAMLLLIVRHSKKVKEDSGLNQALNDDFMEFAKGKSARFGFLGCIFTASALAPLAPLLNMSGLTTAQIVIFLGVSLYLGCWLVVLKKEDDGE